MLNRTRIKRLYIKDLLDILRDHRTLAAVIVVPIVLYPVLMLGALQAASLQADQMKEEQIVIGVQTEYIGNWLNAVLERDVALCDEKKQQADDNGRITPARHPIREKRIILLGDVDLQEWVRQSNGHCAVQFNLQDMPIPTHWSDARVLRAQVIADSATIRSELAGLRLEDVLQRYADWIRDRRVASMGLPDDFIHPIEIQEVDVASAEKRGGSMLGQIIPLILILLTMTGAIYPAIDLTAGERERGTLETLLVCPLPIIEIITGKFLVVTTVSIIGATLNLVSMGATLQFGGFNEALAAGAETEIPVHILPLILLFLIPLAIFFSALLLAVCSFARSFKEAQNYVTPVVIAVLVPAGLAALPGTELEGVMKVMPVANMVLLTREMLVGNIDAGTLLTVVISTCLYAATAVAVAVKVFGQEAVIFADAGSWRAQFDRRLMRPRPYPTSAMALVYVALLFPIWFYLQTSLQAHGENFAKSITLIQLIMFVVFFAVPIVLVLYYKVNLRNTFSLRLPEPRFMMASVLIGMSTWVIAHELQIIQSELRLLGSGESLSELMKFFTESVQSMNPLAVLLLLAVIPAVCEEMLFRGLLLNGLRRAVNKWQVIIAVALIFAVFHYIVQRFAVTFVLGLLLAYLCWQSRSIFTCMVVHVMHNGLVLLAGLPASAPFFERLLRIPPTESNVPGHLPWFTAVLPAGVLLLIGILLIRRPATGSALDIEESRLADLPSDQTHPSTRETPVVVGTAAGSSESEW